MSKPVSDPLKPRSSATKKAKTPVLDQPVGMQESLDLNNPTISVTETVVKNGSISLSASIAEETRTPKPDVTASSVEMPIPDLNSMVKNAEELSPTLAISEPIVTVPSTLPAVTSKPVEKYNVLGFYLFSSGFILGVVINYLWERRTKK